MNFKIILFVLILAILPLSNASIPNSSNVTGKQVDINELNNDLYIKLDKCLPNQLIENNIVFVIDGTESTRLSYTTSNIATNSLIDANAINIIRTINPNTNIGIVVFRGVFRGVIEKTRMLSMKNETNKTYLENFINQIIPDGMSPTNPDEGLLAATDLLNSARGKKEIILFSDGLMISDNKSYETLEKIVKDIRKKDIEINFIRYFMNPEPPFVYGYEKLAEAAGRQVIILNQDERAVHSSLFESCSMKTNETNILTVTTSDGTPISGAEISLDNISIGETTSGELSINLLRTGVHYFTANKPRYNEAVIKVILSSQNITTTQMIKPSPVNDSLLKTEVKEANESLNGFEGFENKPSWLESTIRSILGWFK